MGFRPQLSPKQWLIRKLEIFARCLLLLLFPVPLALGASGFWYFFLYKGAIHFNSAAESIATTAWIPTFGILYSLLAAIVLSTVWNEYKSIRTAVKRYDIDTFMDLRDEDMSPLVHAMMFILSGSVLAAFMGLGYPDIVSGLLCVSSTTYLFALIFFVVFEIDDPSSGIWYIRNIPKEWLEIDPKEWREERSREARELFLKQMSGKEQLG